MTKIRNWYAALSAREQWLVAIAAALLMLIVGLFGITLPLAGAVADAKQNMAEAVERHGRIAAKVDALAKAEAGGHVTPAVPLDTLVQSSAAEYGFVPENVAAQGGDRIGFSLPSLRAPALFDWLSALEGQGARVESLSIQRGDGSLLTARVVLTR